MSKIDITKPLQLADGRKATYKCTDRDGTIAVYVEGDAVETGARYFDPRTGRHYFGELPNIMNAPTSSWSGRSLQTRDGKQARYIGTSDDGQPLFEIVYDRMTRLSATSVVIERRQPDGRVALSPGHVCGDDIVDAKPPEVITYLNIYADGTIGETAHLNYDDAIARTKYGKIRVGILKRVEVAGKLTGAAVLPLRPALRMSSGVTYPFR